MCGLQREDAFVFVALGDVLGELPQSRKLSGIDLARLVSRYLSLVAFSQRICILYNINLQLRSD